MDFDISSHLNRLVAGINVLAFHGLNENIGSSDFLCLPELVGTRVIGGSAITLPSTYTEVKARALQNGEWSALNAAAFVISAAPAANSNLVISEIMYHPSDPSASEIAAGFTDADDFEFLELMNISGGPIDLTGLQFVRGLTFVFPQSAEAIIELGSRVLIVKNRSAFEFRYGTNHPIVGQYVGSLNNGGETLSIVDSASGAVKEFTYDDAAPWPEAADGLGSSLIIIGPNGNPDPTAAGSWRSGAEGGSPGQGDGDGDGVTIIHVNEVLTHTDWPQVDAIELFNPNPGTVDIGGWYLTDDPNSPTKYRLPSGTSVPGNGYLVILEDNDADPLNNASLPAEFFGSAFSLSSTGDEVYLYSADSAGLTGYRNGFGFRGAANGVSFSRLTNSAGEDRYPASSSDTLGSANSEYARPEVVISEIMYNPLDPAAAEYVEIWNVSDTAVNLYDAANPANTWRLDGMNFDFPQGQTLASGELALVVEGDPAAFRLANGLAPSVKVYGPAGGALGNGGERLELLRPDAPNGVGPDVVVPMIVVDAAEYGDLDPWPMAADGQGPSLERLGADVFGDDPVAWAISAETGGSPGSIPGRVGVIVSISFEGQGSVTRSPDKAEYESGEAVSLAPQAAPGWVFAGWEGPPIDTTVPLVLTVNESVSVTAIFEPVIVIERFTLQSDIEGQGSVTFSPSAADYENGSVVNVTAIPAPNYRFGGWEGAVSGSTNPETVTMGANKTVRAIFVQQVSIAVSQVGPGAVTVSSNKELYDVGEQVMLSAVPIPGSVFNSWSGDAAGVENPLALVLDENKAVTANFGTIPDLFPLSVSIEGQGGVTRSPEDDGYVSGTVVQLTSNPQTGWTFIEWRGAVAGASNPVNVTMTVEQNVTAVFDQFFSVSVTAQQGGSVTRAPSAPSYRNGTEITLTAAPAAGFRFTGWTGDASGDANSLTFTMEANRVITAQFAALSDLTLSTQGSGQIIASPNKPRYADGESVTLTAAPAEGWTFVNWEGILSGSVNPATLIISGDQTVTAVFEELTPEPPYEAWTKQEFSEAEQADPAVSGPNADPDGDGLANLLEHVFGTRPQEQASQAYLEATRQGIDGEDALFIKAELRQQSCLTYRLEVSSDLVTWFYNGDTTGKIYVETFSITPLIGGGESITWHVFPPGDASMRWYCRFVAELEE
ncbi:MAG: putative repeat protein (TIGR02543 family) [Verrucomicrobiales bacterium]